MVVAGAVGAAALSIVQVATTALATGDVVGTLPDLLQQRWAVFVLKTNTAGSYFILVLPIAVALAASRRRFRAVGACASVMIGAALWLSGARAVLLTLFALVGVGIVWSLWPYLQRVRLRRAYVAGSLFVFVLVISAVSFRVLTSPGTDMADSVRFRWMFYETTFRMVEARPWLGIGAGQYFFASERFSPPELLDRLARMTSAPRENPHNYFLLILGELGVIGLGLFVWLLTPSLKRGWAAIRSRQADLLLMGTFAGLVACLVTCLAGHPFVYAQVAYAFWSFSGSSHLSRPVTRLEPAALTSSDRVQRSGQESSRWCC